MDLNSNPNKLLFSNFKRIHFEVNVICLKITKTSKNAITVLIHARLTSLISEKCLDLKTCNNNVEIDIKCSLGIDDKLDPTK